MVLFDKVSGVCLTTRSVVVVVDKWLFCGVMRVLGDDATTSLSVLFVQTTSEIFKLRNRTAQIESCDV